MIGPSGIPIVSHFITILEKVWRWFKRGDPDFDVHYLRKEHEENGVKEGAFKVRFLNKTDRKFEIREAKVRGINGVDVTVLGEAADIELAPHDFGEGSRMEFEYLKDELLRDSGNRVKIEYYLVDEDGGRWKERVFTGQKSTNTRDKIQSNTDS